jgi:hypothetical protein
VSGFDKRFNVGFIMPSEDNRVNFFFPERRLYPAWRGYFRRTFLRSCRAKAGRYRRDWGKEFAALLNLLQYFAHHFVDKVDGLEGANHYFEVGDSAVFAPGNHVHAVNGNAVNNSVKFQNGTVAGNDLPEISECFVIQHV